MQGVPREADAGDEGETSTLRKSHGRNKRDGKADRAADRRAAGLAVERSRRPGRGRLCTSPVVAELAAPAVPASRGGLWPSCSQRRRCRSAPPPGVSRPRTSGPGGETRSGCVAARTDLVLALLRGGKQISEVPVEERLLVSRVDHGGYSSRWCSTVLRYRLRVRGRTSMAASQSWSSSPVVTFPEGGRYPPRRRSSARRAQAPGGRAFRERCERWPTGGWVVVNGRPRGTPFSGCTAVREAEGRGSSSPASPPLAVSAPFAS
jgi:hypothetical protein